MTDEPSKHVWKIIESCYVYTTIYIVAAIQTNLKFVEFILHIFSVFQTSS